MKDFVVTFFYASIADIQGTIRAIDAKIGLLLVVLSIPFTNIGKIYTRCSTILSCTENTFILILCHFLVSLFIVFWLLAFVSAIRCLISIRNPNYHIKDSEKYKGSFYCGGTFDLTVFDALRNDKNRKSNYSVIENIERMPVTENELIEELSFEQLKLTYIRDIKTIRQNWSYKFVVFWLFLGFLIYIFSM